MKTEQAMLANIFSISAYGIFMHLSNASNWAVNRQICPNLNIRDFLVLKGEYFWSHLVAI